MDVSYLSTAEHFYVSPQEMARMTEGIYKPVESLLGKVFNIPRYLGELLWDSLSPAKGPCFDEACAEFEPFFRYKGLFSSSHLRFKALSGEALTAGYLLPAGCAIVALGPSKCCSLKTDLLGELNLPMLHGVLTNHPLRITVRSLEHESLFLFVES